MNPLEVDGRRLRQDIEALSLIGRGENRESIAQLLAIAIWKRESG